jgi:hypothetical protein
VRAGLAVAAGVRTVRETAGIGFVLSYSASGGRA